MTAPRPKAGASGFDQLFPGETEKGLRVKTGIVELDEMLRGGFMPGDAVMLAGSAGMGKTTLALEYLVNGVSMGEPGIYVTFEELPDQIYRDAKNFGWDLRRLEEEDRFRLICTSPSLILESGEDSLLDDALRDIQPRRLVIDSLSHLELFVKNDDMRMEAYRVIRYLKTRGVSSMLLWESTQISGGSFSVTDVGLSFLVDCIIALKPVEIESSMRKALVVLKMRGSNHDKRLREYDITSHGIEVSAPFTNYEGLMTGSPRRSVTEEAANNWAMAFAKNKQKHS
ncbi:ATPase [Candidatus Bathyarchaeota archaeon]|nr:MAG: ATPase [Candidatus Bathyarchaeota archaeon]